MVDAPASPNRRLATYGVIALGLVLLPTVLSRMDRIGSSQGHTILEAQSVAFALAAGALAIVQYTAARERAMLFIGAGLMATAALDGAHALLTWELWQLPAAGAMEDLSPWSWMGSRLFLSTLMVLAWIAYTPRGRAWVAGASEQVVVGAVAILAGAVIVALAVFPLPTAHASGSLFPRAQEFVPGVAFLVAASGFLQRDRWREDPFEHWVVIFLIINAGVQVTIMPTSGQLFDAPFVTAHILKLVSYLCIMIGLAASARQVFADQQRKGRALRLANQHLGREIERRAEAENMLRARTADLERSNRDLEQFAYVASHDLQEPLRMVASYVQLLQRRYEGTIDDDADTYIRYAVDGAVRMQTLINDLLAFSRAGSHGRDPEPTDANQVVQEVMADLAARVQETGAQVLVGDLPWVMADAGQLGQVLQNLIGNAMKFAGDDPPRVEMTATTEGDTVTFRVRDHGIGIDPAHRERIFVIFQRLHTREEYEGTGIGLAMCKRIVERHGGRIWVDDVEGPGTAFAFTFKLAAPPDAAEPAEEGPQPSEDLGQTTIADRARELI